MMRAPNLVAAALFLMAVLSAFARMPLHTACCFALAAAFEWGGHRFWEFLSWVGLMAALPGLLLSDWSDREKELVRRSSVGDDVPVTFDDGEQVCGGHRISER